MIPILFRPEADPDALLDVNSVPLQDVNSVELLASGDPTLARLFDTYGLGALTDCISCEVTEERNGEYELVMEYPMTGVHFDEIENRCIVWAKPNYTDDPQAFRIYRISAPIDGVVTVDARHLIYDLSGIPVKPFTATSCANACAGLMSNALVSNPFTIGTQVGTIADFKVDVPSSVRSWFGGKEGSLIDVYGGEWAYDNYTATLKTARGQDRGVVIKYGKNLIDFEQEKNCEEVWTGVLPYWADQETGAVVRANIINVAGSYDYRRILCLDLSMDFEEKPTVADLTAKATSYMTANNIGVPKVSITLDWAQTTEQVELCDTVKVEFEKLGVSAKAKCIRTVWDVLKDRYSTIEIGDPKVNISDTIAGMQEAEKKQETSVSNAMLRAIANATALITGNEGGYFIVHDSNGDGFPDETLWMDTNDIETATRVWRFNQAGLGFSSSGYDGPYGLAITMNGEIVANFITTGELSADRINGGELTLGGANDANGRMQVLNSSGVQCGFWKNDGLQVIDSILQTVSKTPGTLKGLSCIEQNSNGVTKDYASFTQASAVVRHRDTAGSDSNYYQEQMTNNYIAVSRYANGSLANRSYMNATSIYTTGTLQALGQVWLNAVYSNTTSAAANVNVASNGYLTRSTASSKRYKHDITEDLGELDPEKLYDLPVVKYKFNDDYISKEDERYQKDVIGFIAEDVDKLYPIAVRHEDGKAEMWESNYMIPAMMKLIQNQKKEIDELRARLDRLEARYLDDGR